MKIKFLAVLFALTALLLAGCQGNDQSAETGSPSPEQSESVPPEESESASPEQTEPASPEQSEPEPPEESKPASPEQAEPEPPEESEPASPEPSESGAETVFTPGTWLVGDGGQYFFFDEDGKSGSTRDWEHGIGVAFEYEYADGRAVFHMAAADDNTPCAVEITDPEHITLRWDDGGDTPLTYQGAGEIDFYSDYELGEMAIAYYGQATGQDTENLTAGTAANEDGTVTVQVYENLGDHNSTAAWYTVDRFTGQGTDVNSGETVDLTTAA